MRRDSLGRAALLASCDPPAVPLESLAGKAREAGSGSDAGFESGILTRLGTGGLSVAWSEGVGVDSGVSWVGGEAAVSRCPWSCRGSSVVCGVLVMGGSSMRSSSSSVKSPAARIGSVRLVSRTMPGAGTRMPSITVKPQEQTDASSAMILPQLGQSWSLTPQSSRRSSETPPEAI
jgi:hypothetical protein